MTPPSTPPSADDALNVLRAAEADGQYDEENKYWLYPFDDAEAFASAIDVLSAALSDAVRQPTAAQIDAGAEALRQRLQGGKKLRAWEQLPNSAKKKWREYATVVLTAAGGGQ